ncbi:MAG: hypothetical protein C5B52_17645 [Bacteroidetes bacterium]|nr:MAG: hypothetical protein C5B52_17645 [Bacteroidota bacterium]
MKKIMQIALVSVFAMSTVAYAGNDKVKSKKQKQTSVQQFGKGSCKEACEKAGKPCTNLPCCK